VTESNIGFYEAECAKINGPFRAVNELVVATLSWAHWFNANRPHSSIREINTRQQPLPGELALYRTRAIQPDRR
jgi:putative transposase